MKKALGMVYNTLGLVWLKRKNVSEAISSFRKAIDQDPDLLEARLNLAALSLNYRDYVTAEQNSSCDSSRSRTSTSFSVRVPPVRQDSTSSAVRP